MECVWTSHTLTAAAQPDSQRYILEVCVGFRERGRGREREREGGREGLEGGRGGREGEGEVEGEGEKKREEIFQSACTGCGVSSTG